MAQQTLSAGSFLDTVHSHARAQIDPVPDLGVWRTTTPQPYGGGARTIDRDSVVVGMLDKDRPSEPSVLTFLTVCTADGVAHIKGEHPELGPFEERVPLSHGREPVNAAVNRLKQMSLIKL